MKETPTVVVGMSGGVDSFATALLLKRQGFRIIGAYLKLWKDSSGEEVKAICRRLGIECCVYDGQEVFRELVVKPFVEEYRQGHTPNPCTFCNNQVKWNLLQKVADGYGIEKIATGHYIQIRNKDDVWYVCKGIDPAKDQSYFLWGLKQEILSRSVTPLGAYFKEDVRRLVQAYGYGFLTQKRESMGICFLEQKDYRDFIVEYTGKVAEVNSGDIVDRRGEFLGFHKGLQNYTIGQKRGIPFRDGQPMYVACIDYENNRIIVDEKQNLYQYKLILTQVNVANTNNLKSDNIEVKVRGIGLNPKHFALEVKWDEDYLAITLAEPAWAVAPGQPVVLYRDNYLIGGGFAVSGEAGNMCGDSREHDHK